MRKLLAVTCSGITLLLVACMPASTTTPSDMELSRSQPASSRSDVRDQQSDHTSTNNALSSSDQAANDNTPSQPSRTEETKMFPPSAWLHIDSTIVQGTVGSFNVADAPPPELMSDVATITVPSEVKPTLIIDESRVQEVHVFLRPWGNYQAQQELIDVNPEGTSAGKYSLEPITASREMALIINAFFDESTGGFDATYIWHLIPQGES